MIRAARGAIQLSVDSKAEMASSVPRLILAMMEQNTIDFDSLISIIFTATADLVSDFPAAAARSLPLGEVPLICATEISVPGSLPRVIRILMHFETNLDRSMVKHVYLEGAQSLRQDLAQ